MKAVARFSARDKKHMVAFSVLSKLAANGYGQIAVALPAVAMPAQDN
jgi:predicted nucleic acid-binding protein